MPAKLDNEKKLYVIGPAQLRGPVIIKVGDNTKKELEEREDTLLTFSEAKEYLMNFYRDMLVATEELTESNYTFYLKSNDEIANGDL